jgi:hypothetical protein
MKIIPDTGRLPARWVVRLPVQVDRGLAALLSVPL